MTSPSRSPRLVVSDSSPLIHLARIGRLGLLRQLFGEITIPQAVYREVVVEGRGKPGSEQIASAPWIRTASIRGETLKRALLIFLDEGEAEAIVLAVEMNADLVLLDEREARIQAKRLGLRVTGTLGILLKSKKAGLVENLREELAELKRTGFRISSTLEQEILNKAGEQRDP